MRSIEKLDHGRVVIYQDWIAEDVFSEVQADLGTQSSRKRLYLVRNPNTPESFKKLNRFIGLRLCIGATAMIGKQYRYDDKHTSRAYKMHIDPPEWHTQDLLTLTTNGEAEMLFANQAGNEQTVNLSPNTLVRMQPDVMHAVTPPLTDEPRHMLFLGQSSLLR